MRRLAFLLLAFVVGCAGIDLVSPVPNTQPRLVVSLAIVHDATTFFNLDVLLARGTNADGLPRAFVDSTMVVNGEQVLPVFEGPQRNVRYEWERDTPPGNLDTLEIRPPIMAGVASVGTLRIVVPPRPGPRTLQLPEGADLTLALPIDEARGSDAFSNWHATARILGSSPLFNSNGNGLPDSLDIPWSWLRASPGDTIVVTYSPSLRYSDTSAAIFTTVLLFRIMEWRVVVMPP